MAKKTVIDEFKQGNAVDTQEIAEAVTPKKGKLVAVAPFELERNYKTIQCNVGDVFEPLEDWSRDLAFEEFRKINTKKNDNGIAFSVPLPILDEKGKLKYMDSRRVILPLEEA